MKPNFYNTSNKTSMENKTPMQELIEWLSKQKFRNTHISDKREIINKAKSLLEKEKQFVCNTAFEVIKRGILLEDGIMTKEDETFVKNDIDNYYNEKFNNKQ